jgi:cobalamin biosynthesis protein CobD/CbiB
MKKFFDKVVRFVAQALRSNTDESSKRLFGAIGFICSIVFIAIWSHALFNELLYVSVALLGLESFTNIFKKK